MKQEEKGSIWEKRHFLYVDKPLEQLFEILLKGSWNFVSYKSNIQKYTCGWERSRSQGAGLLGQACSALNTPDSHHSRSRPVFGLVTLCSLSFSGVDSLSSAVPCSGP